LAERYFGERPISFRSLLKRPFLAEQQNVGNSTGQWVAEYVGMTIPRFLPTYTEDVTSVEQGNLYGYLRYAYLGMRGGICRRVRFLGIKPDISSRVNVSLIQPSNSLVIPNLSYKSLGWATSYLDGTVHFNPHTNSGVEFELPFYTNNQFVWSQNTNPYSNTDSCLDPYMTKNFLMDHDIPDGADRCAVVDEAFMAEDFCFLRFLSSPPYTIPKSV